jgi:hypothetical protein
VGLMAGSKVDLGVETSVRQYQTTAIAALEQAASRSVEAAGRSPAGARSSRPTNPTSVVQMPTATAIRSDAPASQPTAKPQMTRQSMPTPILSTPTPTVIPTEAPIRRPLLMANPEFKNLNSLDGEMKRSAVGRPVQIRYQEEALNQEIAALIDNNPSLPYSDVYVDLKRDQVVVRGNTVVLGFQVSAEVTGRVTVSDCRPQVEIESISLVGLLAPTFVQDQIKDMFLEALDWYPADYPLCLEQIVLEEGRATVYGHRR